MGAWIAIDIAKDYNAVLSDTKEGKRQHFRMGSSQAHTTAIVKPESASRRLLLWDLQTFLSPDTSDLCGSRLSPASVSHHPGNKAITIPAIGAGHTDLRL